MSIAWLQELKDRHSTAGPMPEHHRDHPCDACRLLTLLDAQTRMLSRSMADAANIRDLARAVLDNVDQDSAPKSCAALEEALR